MADKMECDTCGGTDFYKESGYFYCKECQTQSQEVREHVFQDEVINLQGVRKIKTLKTEKQDNKITSWECYNIVMCSLTEQLINLGADKNLKRIVKCLWIKYLQKLEVIDLKRDIKPKLQIVNSRRDCEILYGILPKKRKRKKSSDESSISQHTGSTKREQSKKKRALVQAHYEEFSQKSIQEGSSLHNETLTSLKSDSDKMEKDEEKVNFNIYGSRELKKKLSVRHIRKHKLDKARNLQCHKLTYDNCSFQYKGGVHFLSPIKLYCILYLGLLINRDEMQLGDLFRFIREGHLTFNNFTELFPEEYSEKFLNIQNNRTNKMFSHTGFRQTSAKMAVFLEVISYIKVVDLTVLCRRFCEEMNLPDEVFTAAKNIISKTNPKLSFSHTLDTIPNYEGRAMSIIVFTLKLLFGLDGITEWKLSNYAQLVNKLNLDKPKMFDIINWLEYVGYRNLLVSEHHFPTTYLNNSDQIDSDQFLQWIASQEMKPNENVKLTKEMKSYKELLTKIIGSDEDKCDYKKFAPSFTPFLDYSQALDSPHYNLHHSFRKSSLEFLLKPNKYLDLVSDNLQVVHGGANSNWIIEELKSYVKMNNYRRNLSTIPIRIIKKGVEKDVDETINSQIKVLNKKLDPQSVQETYHKYRKHVFHENEVYLKRISKDVRLNNKVKTKIYDYKIHYRPYERYWLYLLMTIERVSKKNFETHFAKHPSTFKLIFGECARIIEQTTQEFLYEFQYCELFLVFATNYCDRRNKDVRNKLLDRNLEHYVDKAKNYW